MAKSDWVPTPIVCEQFGITDTQLYALRDEGLLKKATHWRDVGRPKARRPTYRWHLKRCEKAIDER